MDELSPDEGEDPYANDPFFKMVHDVEWNACIGRQGEGVGTRAVRNRTLRANEAGTLGSPPQPTWKAKRPETFQQMMLAIPSVNAGQIDVHPAQRRDVLEQVIRNLATHVA